MKHSLEEKRKPILLAFGVDLGMAGLKLAMSILTRSSAMLSEGIHSLSDAGNQLLLLFGIHQSLKPADEDHPFGFGKELYFWGLIVAIVVFAISGGISIYEGALHLVKPSEPVNSWWNYIGLAFALVVEGFAWYASFKEYMKEKDEEEGLWEGLKESKNPILFINMAEDSAAIIGIIIVFIGIAVGDLLHSPLPDALASLVIGVLLTVMAMLLAYESKNLLIGEAANPKMVQDIRRRVLNHQEVEQVRHPLTMHFGPEEIFLSLDVRFKKELQADEVMTAIDDIEKEIRQAHPAVGQIFIEIRGLEGSKDGKNEK